MLHQIKINCSIVQHITVGMTACQLVIFTPQLNTSEPITSL